MIILCLLFIILVLVGLNYSKEQQHIFLHRDSHALISAGPGSGKTTTLNNYIISLLQDCCNAKDLLVLMFNKSAQKDFVKKLEKKNKNLNLNLPEIRTFHSISFSIINTLVSKGLMPKMELISSQKYLEVTAMNACEKTVGNKKFRELQNKKSKVVDTFVQYISLVKSNILLSPKETFENLGIDSDFKFFIDAFDKFENQRKYQKVRFFDDLLFDLGMLIQKDAFVRNWLGNKKKYVIIDEYQDTNVTQSIILKTIVGNKGYCVAVGDADQSLYEFRGAHPGIMTKDFDFDFPNAKKYKLSYNFRYGRKLALIANSIISNNKDRIDQMCISHSSNPETNFYMRGTSDQGKDTLKTIKKKLNEGYSLDDIVVLVRLYSQSVPIELSLLNQGYKVNIEGGSSALDSKEMEAFISLLEISAGKFSNLTKDEKRKKFEVLLKFPHIGINSQEMEALISKLSNMKSDFGSALVKHYSPSLQKFQLIKIKERGRLIEYFEKEKLRKKKTNSYDMLKRYVRETDIKDGLSFTSMTDQEYSESIDRMDAILNFIKSKNVSSVDLLNLLIDFKKGINSKVADNSTVKITTIHRSKGLEWPIVIVPGLIEYKFPYEPKKSTMIGNHEEGERRLFYVAVTRGTKEVHVLTSNSSVFDHYLNHGSNISQVFSLQEQPSKFIFETEFFGLEKCGYKKANKCPQIVSLYDKAEMELN